MLGQLRCSISAIAAIRNHSLHGDLFVYHVDVGTFVCVSSGHWDVSAMNSKLFITAHKSSSEGFIEQRWEGRQFF